MKQRTRKVRLWTAPKVESSYYAGAKLTVTVEGEMGATRILAEGELSPHCASRLIRELRRGLREIRANHLKMMDETIGSAEGPL